MQTKSFRLLALLLVVLALLLLAQTAWAAQAVAAQQPLAQGDPPPEGGLPSWFQNIAIAGVLLAPIATVVVQIIKSLGAQLGMPEGYGGVITGVVVVVLVIIAVGAGVLQIEPQVSEALVLVQRIGEALLTLLAALGWYEVGKAVKFYRPVAWFQTASFVQKSTNTGAAVGLALVPLAITLVTLDQFPAWFTQIAVAGLAVAPVGVVIAQILIVMGARLGMPESYTPYILAGVVLVLVVVAVGAGVFEVEDQVAGALATIQRVAEAVLALLAAFGWYQVGAKMQLYRAGAW